ncbi:hypothetical protein ABK040_000086 [Willaertia magna]
MYLPDGSGRDAFIFLEPKAKKGTIGNRPSHWQEENIRQVEFWEKANKKNELFLTKRTKTGELQFMKTLNKTPGTTSEYQDQKYITTQANLTQYRTSKITTFGRSKSNASGKTHIPGFSGHIPKTYDAIGLSVSGDKWVDKQNELSISNSLNLSPSLPSFKENKPTTEKGTFSGTFKVNPSSNPVYRFVSPVRNSKALTSHSITGYQGHAPSNKKTQEILDKCSQPTLRV